MRWLLIPFVVIPFVELYLLVLLSRGLGFGTTVALTLVTGVLGGSLAKREIRRVWRGWTQRGHESPDLGLLESALVLLGGVLLLSPGILTDLLGLALLVPPLRQRVVVRFSDALLRRLAASVYVVGAEAPGAGYPDGRANPARDPKHSAAGSGHSATGPTRTDVIDTSGESVP